MGSIIAALGGGDETEGDDQVVPTVSIDETADSTTAQSEDAESEPPAEEKEPAQPAPAGEENVSREQKSALRAAEHYLDTMPFSKEGLYEQLTSEYGNNYPDEAARYAVENVQADWNEQALKSAKNYLEIMPMSDNELFEQLTSEFGEKFTPEQAQYAIDNL